MQSRNFDSLKPYITKRILVLSSKYLDEFENNVSNAFNMSNEIVLTQLLDNLEKKERLNLVFDNVKKISPNAENILENLANTLGDNSGLNILSTNFLQLFFDQKKDTYSTVIAKNNFVKQNSANAIIKMSSIFILCYLAVNKIAISELANHFENKKPVIKQIDKVVDTNNAQLKKPLIQKNAVTAAMPADKIAIPAIKESTKSFNFKIVGLVALLAIGIAVFYIFGISNVVPTADNTIVNTTVLDNDQEKQEQIIAGEEDITKLGDFIDFTLPSDEIITIPEKGVEKALLDIVLDKTKTLDESSFWLCLDRIHFNGREVKYKVESDEQIKNLSLILASFPKIEINIGCYTDNLGNAASNLALSKQRAESLKAGLINFGISENRIKTEGFGDGFPIAENTTPENQKMNRRISIKISQL